jgi:alpha-L-fucosidase
MKIIKQLKFAFILISGVFQSVFPQTDSSITQGIFQPSWKSLEENYKCPDWFRDAKFGIWAHWSAQCVPEQGDWYARRMYLQGDGINSYHVKNYGHPSKVGFMEIENMWKAENWNPEKLMELYKRAGAKYFVALANHHDNFDAYDSKYHAWNSVNIGPHKDIVGTWAKIARANGLHFGVSNHSAHAWHWYQSAYGYDPEGEMAGVRYDAYTLTKEDGKGKWWEGLDPQELYTGPSMVMPDGITTIDSANKWHEANDRRWIEEPPANNPGFVNNWFLRCKDLIDKYHPDLIYFDNYGLPLGQAGLDAAAHYYNASMQWNNGKLETVINGKQLSDEQKHAMVAEYERGFCDEIQPLPWQTCSCIGEWQYSKPIADNNNYKSVEQVVHMLIDIVSKNGNLLLSIPMRGDGTIDEHEVDFLNGMADWLSINGEAIYGTRPWKIYGEGPTQVNTGMFNENNNKFTSEYIRFTTKDGKLYAFLLGVPVEATLIKCLSKNSLYLEGEKIAKVTTLGYEGELDWLQTEDGLKINMTKKNNLIKIFFCKNLKNL